MCEWSTHLLGEVASIQTGPFGSQLHMHDYVLDGTPIITVEHLGENRIIHHDLPRVSSQDKERLKKYTLEEGDIVFSRVGSVDRRAYVTKAEDNWMFSGRCLRVRCNRKLIDGNFLSYYFGQESFKEYIRMVAVGATMPSINTQILSEISITVPCIELQKSVAEVLNSLDAKIDLLHRNNRSLQGVAETLFQLCSGIGRTNDMKQSYLGDLFVETIGGEWGKEIEDSDHCVKVRCIRGTDIGTLQSTVPNPPTRYVTQKKFEKCKILPGDIVIEVSGGTDDQSTGRAYFFDDNLIKLLGGKVVFSNFCRLLRPKSPAYPYYLYVLLRQIYDRGDFFNLENGTSGIRNLALNSFLFQELYPLASKKKVLAFHNQVTPVFEKLTSNLLQIQNLVQLRDAVLPKLMSGSLTVTK